MESWTRGQNGVSQSSEEKWHNKSCFIDESTLGMSANQAKDCAVDACAMFLDADSITPHDKCIFMLIGRVEALERELDAMREWRDVYTGRKPPKRTPHPIPRVEELICKYTKANALAIQKDNAAQLATLTAVKPTWAGHISPTYNVIEAAKFLTSEAHMIKFHACATIIHDACKLLNGILPTCPDVIVDDIVCSIEKAIKLVHLSDTHWIKGVRLLRIWGFEVLML